MQEKVYRNLSANICEMDRKELKYKQVIDLLKASKPKPESAESIEAAAWRTISSGRRPEEKSRDFVEYVFGWTLIPWVRRAFITAAFMLIALFILQQATILKEISQISSRIDRQGRNMTLPAGIYQERSLVNRFRERRLSPDSKSLEDLKIDELLRSIDQLKEEYSDLRKIIEDDPELKKMIEKKLSEIDGNQIKL